ncbi:MAG: hypothetical protein EHM35_15870 [Planctomycetaceae bacterium]|nr:MAG: hypothetical protein EHM35_15870 [Planctomycetaceae bacterium]
MKHWSRDHDECQNCHSSEHPHKGKGLCVPCYYRQYKRKPRPKLLTYEDGLQDAVYAVNSMLDEHDATCWLRDNTIYIQAAGKTAKKRVG